MLFSPDSNKTTKKSIIPQFEHLTVYKMCLQTISNLYVKTGFGIKQSTMADMP